MYGPGPGGIGHEGTGIEGTIAHPGVDDVAVGSGGRFERVGGGAPGEFHAVYPGKLASQVGHRQGLHHIVEPVLEGDEFQDALIHGPGHQKPEARVEPVAHVGQILVREQFEQHGGNFGHTGLEIGFVPHAPPAPLGGTGAVQVVGDLREHEVGEVARYLARYVVEVDLAVLAGEIDAQTAYGRVVGSGAGIGVEGEGQVDGYVQPRAVGEDR